MSTFFVTGGAGFIGSTFCDTALERGHRVVAYDDLSTGKLLFLEGASAGGRFTFVRGDIQDLEHLTRAMSEAQPTWVIHFAANADVRRGTERTRKDLDSNTIGTWSVLEAMRQAGCQRIIFSSTGSVYGEPEVFPTPETCPFPVQTSFYGASKLAGEALIAANVAGFGLRGTVFRFVSILGPRYTHGHVFDFMRQLGRHPGRLSVLGDGNQTKSYLHISDLMAGLWLVIERDPQGFSVFNIGHDDALTVKQSIGVIVDELGLSPTVEFAGGQRGWVGDSPRIQLDTTRLKGLGWSATRSLETSVRDTVRYLKAHPNLLEDT